MAKHLELDVLRTFEAVVREGSFARAAERMCLTAPAISLQMKRLDAVLGGDVFYKDGRGKSLTDKGQRLLEHARRMLHLNDLALSELLSATKAGLGITVRSPQQLTRDLVKVSPGLGLPMLPDVSVAMRINDNGPSSQALTRHIAELVRNVVLVEAARVVRPLDDVVGHDAVEAFSVPKCAVKDDMGQPIGRPDRERMGSRGGTAELA
ncbi:MAG: LysR family transcriptional regulator [Limnohabitans sp.]|uniref:LysR family transcriptional regulator n=1 Tax=Limnohabitans sp. TaxID=1907725 RepID=UPI003BAF8F4B